MTSSILEGLYARKPHCNRGFVLTLRDALSYIIRRRGICSDETYPYLDKKVIQKAKAYAKSRDTSLSRIVENYFYFLAEDERMTDSNTGNTPITDSLTGALDKRDIDEKKEI